MSGFNVWKYYAPVLLLDSTPDANGLIALKANVKWPAAGVKVFDARDPGGPCIGDAFFTLQNGCLVAEITADEHLEGLYPHLKTVSFTKNFNYIMDMNICTLGVGTRPNPDSRIPALVASPDYLSGPLEFVSVNFTLPQDTCECGAAKVGVVAYGPGHSNWCRLASKG